MACVRDCAAQKRVCTCPRSDQKGANKPGQDPKKPDQDYVPKERK
jgi:hypothetical protein